MKRNIFAAILLLAVLAYSCTTKEEPFQEDPASSLSDIALIDDGTIVYEPAVMVEDFILDDEADPETKTVLTIDGSGAHFTFTTGDRIGVFPYTVSDAPQMPFTLKSSNASSCYFNCPGFSLKSGVRYAAYYPYDPTDRLSYTAVPVNYNSQWQPSATTPAASTSSNFNISSADYLLAQAAPSGGACQFKMSHIGALVVMDVTIGQSATYTEISLNSSSASFIQTGTLNVGQTYTQGTNANPTQGIAITSTSTANKMALKLGSSSGSGIYLTAGQTYRFCMMVPPTNVNGIVTIRLKDSSNVEHIAYVPGKNFLQGYAYRYTYSFVPINLSANGTANSYIVSAAGNYYFNCTVAGNGQVVNLGGLGAAYQYPASGTSALPAGGGVRTLLNQNNCVTDVYFADGFIHFTATGAKGNAKLQLRDTNDDGAWVWLIWCTDQPSEITLTDASSWGYTYKILDRNIGAITAGVDEDNPENMFGLYYQFGNPHPYTSSQMINNADSGGYRMRDAIAYNDKPFYGPDYYWFNPYSGGGNQAYAPLWGGGSVGGGDINDHRGPNSIKTLYDPCPAGYKVTPSDFSISASDAGANIWGWYKQGTDGVVFFPYNGECLTGWGLKCAPYDAVNDVAAWTSLWTSSLNNRNMALRYYIYAKDVNRAGGGKIESEGRVLSYGCGIRCVSEDI